MLSIYLDNTISGLQSNLSDMNPIDSTLGITLEKIKCPLQTIYYCLTNEISGEDQYRHRPGVPMDITLNEHIPL